ncbi:MAG TPA: hypothetical protein VEA69_13485 [Tepidisphaeraceae bacterium]|nr:hypothetical protein [Tepidisphaeraceae bacterium]
MGSSYIEYDGQGFWARDELIELWLRIFSDLTADDATDDEWFGQVRREFRELATTGFVGCVDPRLDALIDGRADRRTKLLRQSEAVISVVGRLPDVLTPAQMGAWRISGMSGAEWEEYTAARYPDLGGQPTQPLRDVATAFTRLLNGTWRGRVEDTWVPPLGGT